MGTPIMRVTSYFLVIFFSCFGIIIKTWCHDHFFGWCFSMCFAVFRYLLIRKQLIIFFIGNGTLAWKINFNGMWTVHISCTTSVLLLLQFLLANYFICLLHFLNFRFMLVYLSHLCEFSNLSSLFWHSVDFAEF